METGIPKTSVAGRDRTTLPQRGQGMGTTLRWSGSKWKAFEALGWFDVVQHIIELSSGKVGMKSDNVTMGQEFRHNGKNGELHCQKLLRQSTFWNDNKYGFPESWGYPSWMVFVRENPFNKWDDDSGYPHDSGNPHHSKSLGSLILSSVIGLVSWNIYPKLLLLLFSPGMIYWLVVGPPLWKIWVRQLGWWNSQYMGE